MDFRVDYIKVNETGLDLEAETQNLIKKFKELLKIVDNFETCWSGSDYQSFKENFINYVLSINPMIDNIEYISKFMQKAANNYSDNDNDWLNDVKKIGVDNNDKE